MALPGRLRLVARHGDNFEDCVFLFGEDDDSVACKLLFAMQQPMVLFFGSVKQVEDYLDVRRYSEFSPWPRLDFEVDFKDIKDSTFLHDVPMDDIFVVSGCWYRAGSLLRSSRPMAPLASVLAALPKHDPTVKGTSQA